MFGHIVKTIILTIFALIILHFTIEHTKNIWYIPKHTDYDASYKKIVELLDTLPDKDSPTKSIEPINSINPMEAELSEYITNMT